MPGLTNLFSCCFNKTRNHGRTSSKNQLCYLIHGSYHRTSSVLPAILFNLANQPSPGAQVRQNLFMTGSGHDFCDKYLRKQVMFSKFFLAFGETFRILVLEDVESSSLLFVCFIINFEHRCVIDGKSVSYIPFYLFFIHIQTHHRTPLSNSITTYPI